MPFSFEERKPFFFLRVKQKKKKKSFSANYIFYHFCSFELTYVFFFKMAVSN